MPQAANHSHKLPQMNVMHNLPPNNLGRRSLWLAGIALVMAIATASALVSAQRPHDEISWLSSLATAGDNGAQLEIGLAYRDGRYGLNPDASTALYWLKRSADNGNAYAEASVGDMYAAGTGVSKDPAVAMRWWQQASADGNHEARLHLAEALIKAGDTRQAESILKKSL